MGRWQKEEETIDNPAEYSSKSDFSKAEVVRQQVCKCNEIRSQEMREGYFNYDGPGHKTYIPDSRKAWISAVKALLNLLKPEISQKKYGDKIGKVLDREKDALETFGINIPGSTKPVIPYLDQAFPRTYVIKSLGAPSKRDVTTIKGLYNDNFHNYWDEMVDIYDQLFGLLNILIHESNYFKQEISF